MGAPKRMSRVARVGLSAFVLLGALGALGACKKKPKPFPPAPQLVSSAISSPISSATTAGAALGASDAALVGVPAAAAAPKAATAAVAADTMSPGQRATLEQAKASLAELAMMVKKGVLTNPDRPDDGDATTKCAALEESRPELVGIADAEARSAVAELTRLCSFEVPIVSADKALEQVTISPSQASRKLICGFASKDIEKARRHVKAGDRRVRDLEARYGKACR